MAEREGWQARRLPKGHRPQYDAHLNGPVLRSGDARGHDARRLLVRHGASRHRIDVVLDFELVEGDEVGQLSDRRLFVAFSATGARPACPSRMRALHAVVAPVRAEHDAAECSSRRARRRTRVLHAVAAECSSRRARHRTRVLHGVAAECSNRRARRRLRALDAGLISFIVAIMAMMSVAFMAFIVAFTAFVHCVVAFAAFVAVMAVLIPFKSLDVRFSRLVDARDPVGRLGDALVGDLGHDLVERWKLRVLGFALALPFLHDVIKPVCHLTLRHMAPAILRAVLPFRGEQDPDLAVFHGVTSDVRFLVDLPSAYVTHQNTHVCDGTLLPCLAGHPALHLGKVTVLRLVELLHALLVQAAHVVIELVCSLIAEGALVGPSSSPKLVNGKHAKT